MGTQRLSRRDFLRLSAATTTGVLLASCAPRTPVTQAPQAAQAPQEEKITITILDPTWDTLNNVTQEILAEYTEAHPNVTFAYETVQYDEVHRKAAVAIAGGGGPDFFQCNSWSWPIFTEKGTVLEVEPTAFGVSSVDELAARYVPGLIESFKIQGKLTALPTVVSSYLPQYMPSVYVNGFPKTWAELLEVGPTITKEEGGAYVAQAFAFDVNNGEHLLAELGPFIWEAGGDFVDVEAKKCMFNAPEAVAGVELMRRMVDEKVWVPDMPSTSEMMVAGQIGARMCGDWCLPDLDAMCDEAGVPRSDLAQMPRIEPNGPTKNYIVPAAYLVNANTKYPSEVWKVVAFLLSEESAKRFFEAVAFYSGLVTDYFKQVEEKDPRIKLAHQELSNGTLGLMSSKYEEIITVLVEATQAIMLQNSPIQATLDEAAAKVDEILAAE